MTSSDWLLIRRPRPAARYRVLCAPNAGAGVLAFRGWAEALPDAEVALASLPGRDSRRRDPFCASIQDAADHLTEALHGLPAMPLVLFGHSMGALIVFEIAHRLVARAATPVALVVSGRRAPTCPSRFPPVAHLPEDAFVDQMQRRYAGIPDLVLQDEEMRAWFLPTLRADMALVDQYAPAHAHPLPCPVLAYGGTTDPQTTPDELQAWALQTTASHRVRWFAGGHFFPDTARAEVLTAIGHDLEALLGRSASSSA
jgi:medium-chain acyl-[acyl-carrier-protein] hydrolase